MTSTITVEVLVVRRELGLKGATMLCSNEFLLEVQENPVEGVLKIFSYVSSEVSGSATYSSWIEKDFYILIDAYALLVVLIDGGFFEFEIDYPAVVGEFSTNNCNLLWTFIKSTKDQCVAEKGKNLLHDLKSKYKKIIDKSAMMYEFTQGDLERVQFLINQLREIISNTSQLEESYRWRLLNRLEKMQSELHKKMSDLDRFYGLVSDAGVVLAKLGNDAKPIVDRVREISNIVWRTQSRAEELPSDARLPQIEVKSKLGD